MYMYSVGVESQVGVESAFIVVESHIQLNHTFSLITHPVESHIQLNHTFIQVGVE